MESRGGRLLAESILRLLLCEALDKAYTVIAVPENLTAKMRRRRNGSKEQKSVADRINWAVK